MFYFDMICNYILIIVLITNQKLEIKNNGGFIFNFMTIKIPSFVYNEEYEGVHFYKRCKYPIGYIEVIIETSITIFFVSLLYEIYILFIHVYIYIIVLTNWRINEYIHWNILLNNIINIIDGNNITLFNKIECTIVEFFLLV